MLDSVVKHRLQGSELASDSVRSVSVERWREAQEWELAFWREGQRKRGWKRIVWPAVAPILRALNWRRARGDDWNHWWKDRFDGYRFLPPHLGDCIELGCGPYTNMRLILEGRKARRVVCSDPLVNSYITFRGRWLAEAHARGLVEIDDYPAEEPKFPPASFDLVVMINVLDHVRDADLCMRKAIELLRPGGYIVLGQDLRDDADIADRPHDVGHPIRLRRQDLEPYLQPLTTVLRADVSREESRDPRLHYATLVYAGRSSRAPKPSLSAPRQTNEGR
jgi:SAM-dependent methyltransferase